MGRISNFAHRSSWLSTKYCIRMRVPTEKTNTHRLTLVDFVYVQPVAWLDTLGVTSLFSQRQVTLESYLAMKFQD